MVNKCEAILSQVEKHAMTIDKMYHDIKLMLDSNQKLQEQLQQSQEEEMQKRVIKMASKAAKKAAKKSIAKAQIRAALQDQENQDQSS